MITLDIDPRRMNSLERLYFHLCVRYRASGYKRRYERLIKLLSKDWIISEWRAIYDETIIDF